MKLDSYQSEAVETGDGFSLVIAGAGTGKTLALTNRCLKLLKDGVNPENIFLFTFTNKASEEMIKRIKDNYPENLDTMVAGTFHHIGNTFLQKYKREFGIERYSILDEGDSLRIFRKIIKSKEEYKYPPKIISSAYSFQRNARLSINQIATKFAIDEPSYTEVIDKYEEIKSRQSFLDFDDLLDFFLSLLNKVPIAESAHHILVDEFQDSSKLQILILKELSKVHKNLFVVGDDGQAIYGWRGADSSSLIGFDKVFMVGSKKFFLNRNYRSTPEILRIANFIINLNEKQFKKALFTDRASGGQPTFVYSPNQDFEANHFIKILKEDYKDTAVLFRSRYLAHRLENRLTQENIPYIIRGGVRFFQQEHIKDVVSLLKIKFNLHDEISWNRFLQLLPGIGPRKAEAIIYDISTADSLEDLNEINFKKLGKFEPNFKKCINLLSLEPEFVISGVLDTFYDDYGKKHYEDWEERKDDYVFLLSSLKNATDLEEFLRIAALNEEFRGGPEKENEHLILSTIHMSKGLEWRRVILLAVSDGAFPNPKAIVAGALEEERRLFYVAVTRSKEELFLSQVGPSRFIEELQEVIHKGDNLTKTSAYGRENI